MKFLLINYGYCGLGTKFLIDIIRDLYTFYNEYWIIPFFSTDTNPSAEFMESL